RQLHQKARRRIHVGVTEERSTARVGQIRMVLRAGDADVAEAPLFFQLRLLPAIDRADVRENTLLHTGHEHDRELEALHRVHGDDLRFLERLTDAYLVLASGREQRGARLVAEAARRGVEHARESERVLRISDEPQVRKRVLHLAALVEGDAADDLVREPEGAEG